MQLTKDIEIVFSAACKREEQEDETAWEQVQAAWMAAVKKLSDWGFLSPRLMIAGGGLFMTLSNWGLLPPVSFTTTFQLMQDN